jgi:hypothetical protein
VPLKEALRRRVDTGGECAFHHRSLPERRDLDAWSREGQPVVETAPNRVE